MAIIRKSLSDELQKDFVLSAFTAFQMGAGGDKNFGEYLNHIGLGSGTKPVKETKEQIIAKSRSILEKARRMKHGSI